MKYLLFVMQLQFIIFACPPKSYSNHFHNEKGDFHFWWSIAGESIEIQVSAKESSAYLGVGFGGGGSMYDVDMVLGWVEDGKATLSDRYSFNHSIPSFDTKIGGTDDVELICGGHESGTTTLRFRRLLNTKDKFDAVIDPSKPIDIVYAYKEGSPGKLGYHGDNNHNNINLDLSATNGIPGTRFGDGESGKLSRVLVRDSRVGTLATLQTEELGNATLKRPYPFSMVASYADTQPSSGSALILLTDVERNSINFHGDSRVSLHVVEQHDPATDEPMMLARTTLLGEMMEVDKTTPKYREPYLKLHPQAEDWIDLGNFRMYLLVVYDVYWVGGFGDENYLGWVGSDDYYAHKL